MYDLQIYFSKVNNIRQQSKFFITNNFLTIDQLKVYAKEKNSNLLYNENALALFIVDNNVNRVYFHISSIENIDCFIELLNINSTDKPYIIECLGKEVQLEKLMAYFEEHNINLYTKLSRWRTDKIIGLLPVKNKKMIRLASVEDVKKIQFVFKNVFDPFVSHLPDDEKLKQLIKNKYVYCGILNNDIVAAYCCEKVGSKSLYLYQDAVLDEFNGSGIGVLMLHYVLGKNNTFEDYNCWIEDKNQISRKMHIKLGFKMDGLKSFIFIYNNQEMKL